MSSSFATSMNQFGCNLCLEVANDPRLGHRELFATSTSRADLDENVDGPRIMYPAVGKRYVWAPIFLRAKDQLRQRVAWALSQIFVTAAPRTGLETEAYFAYHDIFVRHAFGNFRALLQEVTFSPSMGAYLTYLGNKAFDYRGDYPDENFAREVMELFTIGLWELNRNGTRVADEHGREVPTYDNEHVRTFARVFTGLDLQFPRGNIEMHPQGQNFIDPMVMRARWHDTYPKLSLDGYLGDGCPGRSIRILLHVIHTHKS